MPIHGVEQREKNDYWSLAPDETENIEEEENLVGFVFDFGKTGIRRPDRTGSTQNLPIPKFPPHDDDSISTLHPSDRTTLTTATHMQSSQSRGRSTQPTYSTNSASSVTSQSTAISTQSF